MATNFPTGLDTTTNPSGPEGGTPFNVVDAVKALQVKSGITGSAVAGTTDKRLAVLEAAAPKNFWGGWTSFAGGAGNVAWKGISFTPTSTITVYGVTAALNGLLADGCVVQGAITTESAGTVATISLTQTFTQVTNDVAGGDVYLPFSSPITMTGGTAYQIMAGYNAGGGAASTTSFPLPATNGNMWAKRYGAPPGTLAVTLYWRMFTLAPIVGTALTSTAGPSTGDCLPSDWYGPSN